MNYENYDDLNNAKKRILSLMQTKYGEEGEGYQESDDTDADSKMNDIINQLDNATSFSFQMIPFIKKQLDRIENVMVGQEPRLTKKGQPYRNNKGEIQYDDVYDDVTIKGASYYRNTNSLLAFNQQALSLSNSLTAVNRIFIKLINDIGYVEPPTMDLYRKSYNKFNSVFDQLLDIAVRDNQLKVIMKDGEQNEHDRNNLINEFNNAMNEQVELEKFNDVINHNYNYKSKTVSVRKTKSSNNAGSNSDFHDYNDE